MRSFKIPKSEILAVMSRLTTGKNLQEVANDLHISVDEAAKASQQWAYEEAARFQNRI